MKNENEYRIDDRLYVKTIKRCTCEEKTGDNYTLYCRIHQRGKNYYSYRPGAEYPERFGGKKLWLSEEAADTVRMTVDAFERMLSELKREEYRFPSVEGELDLYFRQREGNTFDTLVHNTKEGAESDMLFCDHGIAEVIGSVRLAALRYKMYDHPLIKMIEWSTEETLGENPLYAHAAKTGDELSIKQLRLYYNIATAQDCEELGRMLGARILPKLPEAYNKNYVVIAETVDRPLLKNSGYSVAHRPYFAMPGSTHDNWMLNPHRRSGTDAAKKDEPAISFDDFLALFEAAEKDN